MHSDADLLATPPLRHRWVTAPAGPAGPLRLENLDFASGPVRGDDRETAVLVHGVTGHAAAWLGVAPLLATVVRPLAVDLRGHGGSQWSPVFDYATTTHATDLLAVVDALGAERVSVVGSSWGALIALAFAQANPRRVRRLALVDIEPSFSQGETDLMPRPRTFASQDEVEAFERARNPNAPDDVIRAVAAASVRPGPAGLEPWFDPYFFERWPFRSDDWWPTIAAVAAPTLVVHASDSFVRCDVTEQMAALLPNGRHAEITPSTHVVPVDAPAALAEILRAFLVEDA